MLTEQEWRNRDDGVTVGYTPGYRGSYSSGGCIVHGTGYVYRPWVKTLWYARPSTYGPGA